MKRCRTLLNLAEMDSEQVEPKRSRSTPDLSALRRAAQEAGHAPPATLVEFLRLPRAPMSHLQGGSQVSCLTAAGAAAPGGGPTRDVSPRRVLRTLRFAPPTAGEGCRRAGPVRRRDLADGVPSLVHSGSLNELVILEHPSQEDDESTGWPTTSSYGTAATADTDDCRGTRAFGTSENFGYSETASVAFSDCLDGAPCDGYGVFCDIAEAEPEALPGCCGSPQQQPPEAAGGGGGGCSGGAAPEQVGWWIEEWGGNGKFKNGNFNFKDRGHGCGGSSEAFSAAAADSSCGVSCCRRGESPEREHPSVGQHMSAAAGRQPLPPPAAAAAGRRHMTAATLASDLASLLRLGRLRLDVGGGRSGTTAVAGCVEVPMPVLCEGAA